MDRVSKSAFGQVRGMGSQSHFGAWRAMLP